MAGGIMKNGHYLLCLFMAAVSLSTLFLRISASAQDIYQPREPGLIQPFTTIQVRTTETICTAASDGRVFSGVVGKDIFDRRHNLVIQRGSNVELIVRKTAGDELALDLDSITINGNRYAAQTEKNGGGEVRSAIIGAMTGGAGPSVPILTKGPNVDVPARSLLAFQVVEPLRPGVVDEGYMADGIHYHYGYREEEQLYRAKPSIR
jgi:hypothetical protein